MPVRGPRSAVTLTVALGAALAVAVVAGVALGAVYVPPADVVAALGRSLGAGSGPGGLADALVVDIRLPRVLLAALVGACLAVAGALYQAVFRNPLADPYILGVSSGAGLGVVVVIALTAGATALRPGVVPLGAFLGAVGAVALVVRLATRRGRVDGVSLLLAGVAVSYTLAAVTSFIMVLARESMASVVFWMMGGLEGASWDYVVAVAPMLAIGATVSLLVSRQLNLVLLGDERASELGLPVERLKTLLLALASLVTAAAVSVSGLVGFVGLMTPHAVRLVAGPDHRRLLPASMLAGALTMVLADLVARTVLAPVEIPVGIVTAVLGGPFFVWLLVRGERPR